MIFVVGGGGLSPNNAVIHVNAPVGSTVTFSKGGVVVKTLAPSKAHPNADGETADYYFSVSSSNYGEWTVTATLGNDTASDTVTVNAANEYDIKLVIGFYLYNNGDQCTAVTGGWSYAAFLSTDYDAGTLDTAYNGTTCYLSANGVKKQISAVTVNKIDVTDYNALRIEVSDYTSAGSGYKELDLVSSRGNVSSPAAQVEIDSTGTFSVDVSSITGSYYIGLYLNSGSAGSCAIGFKKLYLV